MSSKFMPGRRWSHAEITEGQKTSRAGRRGIVIWNQRDRGQEWRYRHGRPEGVVSSGCRYYVRTAEMGRKWKAAGARRGSFSTAAGAPAWKLQRKK